jgi:hypothetical protein
VRQNGANGTDFARIFRRFTTQSHAARSAASRRGKQAVRAVENSAVSEGKMAAGNAGAAMGGDNTKPYVDVALKWHAIHAAGPATGPLRLKWSYKAGVNDAR